jgi:thiosulfate/3-mercaptopyruvate sulfurtransferase
MPTIYGAQVIGGLVFGIGFVVGGWCPGTAAVGVASGKLDALAFLAGGVLGSIGFNETFALVRPLYEWGMQPEPLFAFGLSPAAFGLVFTLMAVGAFYFAEWVEKRTTGHSKYLRSPLLKALSLAMVVFAVTLFIFPTARDSALARNASAPTRFATSPVVASEQALLEAIQSGEDHMEPEELADRVMRGDADLVVVDIRPAVEYEAFHIRGAVNVPLAELPDYLASWQNRGTIVLYSTGMTHPAQARDTLARLGYQNVFFLTDGLKGFIDRCLKPVSLRSEPLGAEDSQRVRAWRSFFVDDRSSPPAADELAVGPSEPFPKLVPVAWLEENLNRPGLAVIDVRPGPEYSTSHIPGSARIDPESLRGFVGGVHSMLLPAEVLAAHLSLLGVHPGDEIVVAADDKFRDATLVGMALDRLGHNRWGVLEGGIGRWIADGRPVDSALPAVNPSSYAVADGDDGFTVDYRTVQGSLADGRTVILDTRPAEYSRGDKSDEARPGHIPGAVNRPYSEDLDENGQLKPTAELAAAYSQLIPSKDTPVIVHCRTGHQASQTYFVLKHLLGYRNVRWYDAGWTEWAGHEELPAQRS